MLINKNITYPKIEMGTRRKQKLKMSHRPTKNSISFKCHEHMNKWTNIALWKVKIWINLWIDVYVFMMFVILLCYECLHHIFIFNSSLVFILCWLIQITIRMTLLLYAKPFVILFFSLCTCDVHCSSWTGRDICDEIHTFKDADRCLIAE